MLNIGFQRKQNLLFTFLALFFSFVGHGKSFGERLWTEGLDWKEVHPRSGTRFSLEFLGHFLMVFHISLVSLLDESCSCWHGLKISSPCTSYSCSWWQSNLSLWLLKADDVITNGTLGMSICTLPSGVYGRFRVELNWFKTSSEGKLGLNQSLCLIFTGEKSSLVWITGNKKNSVLEVRPVLLDFCRGNYNQFKVLIIWTVAHFS